MLEFYNLVRVIKNMISAKNSKLIQQYFNSKTQELLDVSRQAICEHSGLKGSHREDLIKIYLRDILPKRYEIGEGMIYAPICRSNQMDIIIWDSYNFPSLKMLGSSMFLLNQYEQLLK